MGHYYAEMFPDGKDYRQIEKEIRKSSNKREKDISTKLETITQKNKLTIDDIAVGDKLHLFSELFIHKIQDTKRIDDYNLADYVVGHKLISRLDTPRFRFAKASQEQTYTIHEIDYEKNLVKLNKTSKKGNIPYYIPIPGIEVWTNIGYFEKK